jgi:hypothetical protein
MFACDFATELWKFKFSKKKFSCFYRRLVLNCAFLQTPLLKVSAFCEFEGDVLHTRQFQAGATWFSLLAQQISTFFFFLISYLEGHCNYTYTYMNIYTNIYICIYKKIYIFIYKSICMYVFIYLYIYTYVYISMYIHTYICVHI